MENKKIENPIPELEDEALDQAAGGQARYSIKKPQCKICQAELKTEAELRAALCTYHIENRDPRER